MPDPLAWPPVRAAGRYGDPQLRRSTLYAAIERRAAFLETLDAFRPSITTMAEGGDLSAGDPANAIPAAGVIAPVFLERVIVRFGVAPGQRWLDLRSPETHAALRDALIPVLRDLGYRDRFVLGDLLSHHHDVNRLIAGWAIDHDFHGIAYASCHDLSLTCWAIFAGARVVRLDEPEQIAPTDPDLLSVARMWNLRVPTKR